MAGCEQPAVQKTVKILHYYHERVQNIFLGFVIYNMLYNESTQFVLDIYRKYFGFLAIRQLTKGRKDVFYELHATEEKQSDIEIMKRLSKTLGKLSDMCFKECMNMQYKLFTLEESSCVTSCVESYFKGYEEISRYTHNFMEK